MTNQAPSGRTILGLPVQTAAVCGVLFAAALLGYLTIWRQAPVMSSDSDGYLAVALDLMDFRLDRLAYRPPGYPLLLLSTGSTIVPQRSLFVVSLLLHFGCIWMLARVLHTFGLGGVSLNVFVLLLLLPPYVEPAAYVLSESLAEFAVVAGFASLVNWILGGSPGWLAVCGFAIGYAGLTRPTYQALPFTIAAILFVVRGLFGWSLGSRQSTVAATLIVILTSMSLLGGYAAYNLIHFDYPGVSLTTPSDSATLTTRTSRVVERLPEEYRSVREVLVRARNATLIQQGNHKATNYLHNDGVIDELSRVTGLKGPELARYLLRANLRLIREAPLEYLNDVASAFGNFWFPTNGSLANMGSPALQVLWGLVQIVMIGMFGFTFIMVVGSLPYVELCRRVSESGVSAVTREVKLHQMQAAAFFVGVGLVAHTALISSFFETGDPRYRIPVDGVIALLAFVGMDLVRRSSRLVAVSLETNRDR